MESFSTCTGKLIQLNEGFFQPPLSKLEAIWSFNDLWQSLSSFDSSPNFDRGEPPCFCRVKQHLVAKSVHFCVTVTTMESCSSLLNYNFSWESPQLLMRLPLLLAQFQFFVPHEIWAMAAMGQNFRSRWPQVTTDFGFGHIFTIHFLGTLNLTHSNGSPYRFPQWQSVSPIFAPKCQCHHDNVGYPIVPCDIPTSLLFLYHFREDFTSLQAEAPKEMLGSSKSKRHHAPQWLNLTIKMGCWQSKIRHIKWIKMVIHGPTPGILVGMYDDIWYNWYQAKVGMNARKNRDETNLAMEKTTKHGGLSAKIDLSKNWNWMETTFFTGVDDLLTAPLLRRAGNRSHFNPQGWIRHFGFSETWWEKHRTWGGILALHMDMASSWYPFSDPNITLLAIHISLVTFFSKVNPFFRCFGTEIPGILLAKAFFTASLFSAGGTIWGSTISGSMFHVQTSM